MSEEKRGGPGRGQDKQCSRCGDWKPLESFHSDGKGGKRANCYGEKKMTPEQKLKWAVLAKVAGWENKPAPEYPCANVNELYDALVEADAHWDGKSEVRSGETETGLPCECARHYESKAVAMKMPDGSWVGWTYWYGGGKYGEPEAIDWMEEAYTVDCQEEEKTLIVQTFSKPETANV